MHRAINLITRVWWKLPTVSPRSRRRAKSLCKVNSSRMRGSRPWQALTDGLSCESISAIQSVHIWFSSCRALTKKGRETPSMEPVGSRAVRPGSRARSLLRLLTREPWPLSGAQMCHPAVWKLTWLYFPCSELGRKHRHVRFCPRTSETPGDLKSKLESCL